MDISVKRVLPDEAYFGKTTVRLAVTEVVEPAPGYDRIKRLEKRVETLTNMVAALVSSLPNAQSQLDILNAVSSGWEEAK
jgi:hypothetical protein